MQTSEERRQKALDKELARIRRTTIATLHSRLDDYLTEIDPETSVPRLDTIIAYGGQGWGIAVGISLQQPEDQTELEVQSASSGINIVQA
jgi:hypothetical protein